MENNGQGGLFRVVISPVLKEQFSAMYGRAEVFGIAREVLIASKRIHFRLQSDPTSFGEPLYDLHHTKQQVRTAGVGPLFVTFAVHWQSATVFIKSFVLNFNP